jgi:hypothetical protein
MHSKDARVNGETEQRLYALSAMVWASGLALSIKRLIANPTFSSFK